MPCSTEPVDRWPPPPPVPPTSNCTPAAPSASCEGPHCPKSWPAPPPIWDCQHWRCAIAWGSTARRAFSTPPANKASAPSSAPNWPWTTARSSRCWCAPAKATATCADCSPKPTSGPPRTKPRSAGKNCRNSPQASSHSAAIGRVRPCEPSAEATMPMQPCADSSRPSVATKSTSRSSVNASGANPAGIRPSKT